MEAAGHKVVVISIEAEIYPDARTLFVRALSNVPIANRRY